MTEITVEKLAKIVGTPAEQILKQMQEAGLSQSTISDEVTDQDKKILLVFLKTQQDKSTKTISLKKKRETDVGEQKATVSIKRKRALKENRDETQKREDPKGFDFVAIEKKRLDGEAFKKSEEERKKNEAETKSIKKTKVRRTKDTAVDRHKIVQPLEQEERKQAKKPKISLSKKELKELEGEEYLSKQSSQATKHGFEKPSEFIPKVIQIPQTITVDDLSKKLSIKSGEVLKKLMEMGVMATLNKTLDQDTAILVTEELGHTGESAQEELVEDQLVDLISYEGQEEKRNPVVSVLGHVDHGKTTLLDFIRKSNIVKGEEGGITQRIGAYQALTQQGTITFIDTPGHAAFTEIRARGATSTDIVILVVSADDGLQPQTEEAINHAKAAKTPIVVAINKIDLDGADIEKVKTQLSGKDVVPEDWGGDTQFIAISALKGEGIDELLEAITIQAEVLELKAFHKGPAHGVILDSSTERGLGAVATVLVQEGNLKIGDMVLVGDQTKKIRSLLDENSNHLNEAGPSTPALISGLDLPPKAGDEFIVVTSEKMAKEISLERTKKLRELKLAKQQISNLESLFESELSNHKSLNLLIKADTNGSLEAILGSIKNMETEEIRLNVVHDSVGGINDNDINLAIATNSLVIGFNVRADSSSKRLAEAESIQISYYGVIYDLFDGIKEEMEGSLEPDIKEEILGTAEVKDTFTSPQFGLIAGSIVVEGTIKKNKFVRVIRDNIVIFEGQLNSLRRFKDDVSEVVTGTECGIGIENYSDVKVGDKIEVFDNTEIRRTLS